MTEKQTYRNLLKRRLVIFDGAMGTSLESQNLSDSDFGGKQFAGCNDYLNLTCPDAVRRIHNAYLDAGADVIETNTFRANRITLQEFGLAEEIEHINIEAARIAGECARAFSSADKPRLVAGSMGPSGKLLSLSTANGNQGSISFDEISSVYRQQASALIRSGVDLLLIETAQDILEVKAAIIGIQQAFTETGIQVPIQAQVTLDTNGLMLLGTDIQTVLTILQGMAIDVIGINCSTGPEHMAPALAYFSKHSRLPVSCLPNAGMPKNENGKAIYPLSASDFAEQMADYAARFGLAVVGGCCGTTPDHIRALVEKVREVKQRSLQITPVSALASGFHAAPLHQEPRPFIIGERLNTQGSRRFKRLMLENDFQGALHIARDQASGGAHALDVCTALIEDQQEAGRMETLVKLLANQVDLPIVIDSTNPDVMEAGLKAAPGRCLLNSVNLENGPDKAKHILNLAKTYNAAVIALTIDENGMAKTAEQKILVAQRIFNLAVNELGLLPSALVFDPLTFTLASGSSETAGAALETLEAIRRIKSSMPDAFTVLGVSNISFGLQKSAREILNSVFLFHAVQAGLDLAIVNPNLMVPYPAIDPVVRGFAENLVFNRSSHALSELIAYFENKHTNTSAAVSTPKRENRSMTEKIADHILLRQKEGLEQDLDNYIKTNSQHTAHEMALAALNGILLPAMKEIGDQFGRGELILPFVLQSAEIMRAAADHLENYLEKQVGGSKGTVLLATVYGDVHDIGKNLTHTIIANNGYRIIDLGKQVPADLIVEKAQESGANAVGLSALLVSTSQQMPMVVEKLHAKKIDIPVLIGGAAVNQSFADRIAAEADYTSGVHYCRDAFDALKILDERKPSATIEPPVNNSEPSYSSLQPAKTAQKHIAGNYQQADIPAPPFFGAKTIDIPLDDLFKHLNRPALYRIGWGAGKAKGEKWERYQREFAERLRSMRQSLKEMMWIQPRAAYGYWPCQSDGDALIIYPDGLEKNASRIRFAFPRQPFSPHHCLSDYFSPVMNGVQDVVAFQLVSMGNDAVEYVHQLDCDGNLVESFFAHGLATQLTEAAAQYTHQRIRSELKIDNNRGKRYSWGYAPLPDLSQHQQVVALLGADKSMRIQLTSAFQFIPEYSTAAMIVHHPQAAYFNIEVN